MGPDPLYGPPEIRSASSALAAVFMRHTSLSATGWRLPDLGCAGQLVWVDGRNHLKISGRQKCVRLPIPTVRGSLKHLKNDDWLGDQWAQPVKGPSRAPAECRDRSRCGPWSDPKNPDPSVPPLRQIPKDKCKLQMLVFRN